jgi:SAM-dependent methyltransferase
MHDIAFNPLEALRDPKLFDLFERMLAHRYRTDILHDLYGLPGISLECTWHGTKITPAAKAHKELDFFRQRMPLLKDLENLVNEFWKQLGPQGNHLHDHLKAERKYNEIAVWASDIKLIKPLFYLFPGHGPLAIADLGAGKNRLGAAIIEHFEGFKKKGKASYYNWLDNTVQGRRVKVDGTDVDDWHDRDTDGVRGLAFRLQPSATKTPFKDASRDVVVTKWSFHHMTPSQMEAQVKNLYKILRPGGVVIVIEAFLSGRDRLPPEDGSSENEPTFKQRLLEISRRIEFADIWPMGLWKHECREISEDYLALSRDQQRAILSLEDFFGHYVLNRRERMPFPFSYLPAEDLIAQFKSEGFVEERWNFLLFGFAPIIRRGPPTARFIFRKPGV